MRKTCGKILSRKARNFPTPQALSMGISPMTDLDPNHKLLEQKTAHPQFLSIGENNSGKASSTNLKKIASNKALSRALGTLRVDCAFPAFSPGIRSN